MTADQSRRSRAPQEREFESLDPPVASCVIGCCLLAGHGQIVGSKCVLERRAAAGVRRLWLTATGCTLWYIARDMARNKPILAQICHCCRAFGERNLYVDYYV